MNNPFSKHVSELTFSPGLCVQLPLNPLRPLVVVFRRPKLVVVTFSGATIHYVSRSRIRVLETWLYVTVLASSATGCCNFVGTTTVVLPSVYSVVSVRRKEWVIAGGV